MSDSNKLINCSMIPAHPWVYGLGQKTENGIYLSPTNAISYLAQQLGKIGEISDVVIFLVTGDSQTEFMKELGDLADVLPMPAITQVKRLAQSAAELANEKMLIPSATSVSPPVMPFSTPTTRAALNAQRVSEAQNAASGGLNMEQLKSSLAGFVQTRTALMADLAAGLESLKSKSAKVWVFTGEGDITTMLHHLMQNIPAVSAVHSAAVMLAGDDLAGIRGMIHELDTDTGA